MVKSEIEGFKRRVRLFLALLLGVCAPQVVALDLTATRWEVVAQRHGIEPLLLYALALRETARPNGAGMISPWPWTLGSNAGRRFYDSREDASSALAALMKQDPDVDVGLVQVGLKHHGHRVGDPASLLDPGINLGVAADALGEAINSARGDLALGIGRYRYPDDDQAARGYGRRVLALRDALRRRSPQSNGRDVIDLWRAGAVLDLVADPESRGNYNAWYRAADQGEVQLANFTVEEIRALQKRLVRRHGGSAVGRYQIIDDTLDGLIVHMGLSGKERFTPALQDRMAMHLAGEAGLETWLAGALDDARFAANLARVWAGLPADPSGRSHYAGIAGNRAGVGWHRVVAALRHIRFDGIRQQ
ncbi:hypothetical protein [Thiococcus pfennigii]|uniref:hypothetical protein n=1 Tax=Thiococcus pfennigii TaxID=1057 RepID=UPI001908DCD7|nr:hypothetical protein [Thiococcus pfennigii]MBK1699399.1 hypothetical protein [Thiococcus pfennigii]